MNSNTQRRCNEFLSSPTVAHPKEKSEAFMVNLRKKNRQKLFTSKRKVHIEAASKVTIWDLLESLEVPEDCEDCMEYLMDLCKSEIDEEKREKIYLAFNESVLDKDEDFMYGEKEMIKKIFEDLQNSSGKLQEAIKLFLVNWTGSGLDSCLHEYFCQTQLIQHLLSQRDLKTLKIICNLSMDEDCNRLLVEEGVLGLFRSLSSTPNSNEIKETLLLAMVSYKDQQVIFSYIYNIFMDSASSTDLTLQSGEFMLELLKTKEHFCSKIYTHFDLLFTHLEELLSENEKDSEVWELAMEISCILCQCEENVRYLLNCNFMDSFTDLSKLHRVRALYDMLNSTPYNRKIVLSNTAIFKELQSILDYDPSSKVVKEVVEILACLVDWRCVEMVEFLIEKGLLLKLNLCLNGDLETEVETRILEVLELMVDDCYEDVITEENGLKETITEILRWERDSKIKKLLIKLIDPSGTLCEDDVCYM